MRAFSNDIFVFSRRGQLSIEMLLIAAALLSFLAFLLPASGRFFDSFESHSVDSSQKAVLQQLSFKAREASLLGAGTRFSFTSSLSADNSTFSFDESKGAIKLGYWFAGKQSSLQENSSAKIVFPSTSFPEGNYLFSVYNNGSAVLVEIKKA